MGPHFFLSLVLRCFGQEIRTIYAGVRVHHSARFWQTRQVLGYRFYFDAVIYFLGMDFLHLNNEFGVLICSRCKYALDPGTISSHLNSLHKNEVTKSERRVCVELWKNRPLQPAQHVQQLYLPSDTRPIPNLALFHNGMRCRLCTERPHITGKGNARGMREHLKACHQWESGDKGGRPSKVLLASHDQRAQNESVLSAVIVAPVSYQTFRRSNFTRFFRGCNTFRA